jgi:hypothetical protein
LKEVAELLEGGTLRSQVTRGFFDKIQAEARALKKEANRFKRKGDFDEKVFGGRIVALGGKIEKIFERAVPRCSMSTSELMRLRTDLTATSKAIVCMGKGVALFYDLASQVRDHIARSSQLMDELLYILGLPLGIRLDFDEQELVDEKGEEQEVVDPTSEEQEVVDQTREEQEVTEEASDDEENGEEEDVAICYETEDGSYENVRAEYDGVQIEI